MRRILFEQTDFASLPNPPAGFNYIGFNGATFSQKNEKGTTTPSGGGVTTHELTYEEFFTLFQEGLSGGVGVIDGDRYLITGFDVDLYGGTDVLLTGLPSNRFSLEGFGKFYNPVYHHWL